MFYEVKLARMAAGITVTKCQTTGDFVPFFVYLEIMKHVSVIVYEDVLITALSSVTSILLSANEVATKKGKPMPFEVELISAGKKNVQLSMPVQFQCSRTIKDDIDTDIIIIPPSNVEPDTVDAFLSKYDALKNWLKEQYRQKVQLVCLCTAAYLVADAGLLNGIPATSHWGVIDDLQKRYPEINFKPDHVVTNSKSIITGGGGFSALNAILYLIEKNCGKDIAVELSKFYALDYGRDSQLLFAVFSGQRRHDDDQIHKAQTYIEKKFKTDLSVEEIARQVNMSKRNFIRRFKNATSLNPIEFIQKMKVEAAKKALEKGESNIAAVTYSVGYNDLKTFREVFKKVTGLTPMEYRKKFNTEVA
jgi:transcriptional regulator GlxA family with amidase domain